MVINCLFGNLKAKNNPQNITFKKNLEVSFRDFRLIYFKNATPSIWKNYGLFNREIYPFLKKGDFFKRYF